MDRVAALVGVTSAGLGIAAGHLVAALTSPAASPLVALGGAVIDLTPTAAREFAIRTFGSADKVMLTVVIALVAAALTGAAGVLGRRSLGPALALVGALGAVLILAAVTRPGAQPSFAIPGLVTALVGGVALVVQLRWAYGPRRSTPAVRVAATGPERSTPRPLTIDRRTLFLESAGVVAAAGALGWAGSRLAAGRGAGGPLPAATLPPVASPPPAVPAGLETTVPGVTPLVTAVGDFYRVDTALSIPRPDPATWRLTIGGRVAHPYTLTLADLLAMPLVERDITLTCVSNPVGGPYCGSTRWTGVLVADLLRRADPEPGADMVLSRSVDGFTASTPLAVLLDGRDAMIALGMDGRPLTATHGAPARLLTPGLYGYVGATKWLSDLRVTTFAADTAYWTARGWAPQAPVKTAARIDTPTGTVPAGPVPIAGVAWATHRGIGRIEVQVDDGPWQPAMLGPDVGLDYWRQWHLTWQAAPGRHTLRARAYDAAGQVQTADVADVLPDGATGYPVVEVTVRG
ncbi:molybdopterin-dependent oxidoreductase [Raineyella sp. LH-20]|uniref:molybdopterin-dependent oxidoreductase n=1 Tax=Raineyella sp. LH-20 TaxID=3081204 RepID=UPI0029539E49|nr:molybdopterin-dependent oxidoreductase [Raineyella sp. LH-20]WOP18675.1 molybdopterin-dependent oxidoreductase [Raineyella sp. LH-20]